MLVCFEAICSNKLIILSVFLVLPPPKLVPATTVSLLFNATDPLEVDKIRSPQPAGEIASSAVVTLADSDELLIAEANTPTKIDIPARPAKNLPGLKKALVAPAAVAAAANAQPEEIKKSKKLSLPFGSITLPNLGGLLVKVKSAKEMLNSAIGSVKKAIEKSKELTPVETTADLDINAWIENISREVEAKGAQRRASAPKKTSAAKKSSKKKR